MNEKLFRQALESGRFAIDVARLDADGQEFSGETGDVLDLNSRFMRAKSGVRYNLEVSLLGGELVLRGSLSADIEADCARCCRPFTLRLEVPDFADSIEVSGEEEWIDATDVLREAVLLEIPSYPVHSPDCKGLCPKCGADLNDGPCGCPPEGGDDRWTALDALSGLKD